MFRDLVEPGSTQIKRKLKDTSDQCRTFQQSLKVANFIFLVLGSYRSLRCTLEVDLSKNQVAKFQEC